MISRTKVRTKHIAKTAMKQLIKLLTICYVFFTDMILHIVLILKSFEWVKFQTVPIAYTQWTFGDKMTSYRRRCDVVTSHRRKYDVILRHVSAR